MTFNQEVETLSSGLEKMALEDEQQTEEEKKAETTELMDVD